MLAHAAPPFNEPDPLPCLGLSYLVCIYTCTNVYVEFSIDLAPTLL